MDRTSADARSKSTKHAHASRVVEAAADTAAVVAGVGVDTAAGAAADTVGVVGAGVEVVATAVVVAGDTAAAAGVEVADTVAGASPVVAKGVAGAASGVTAAAAPSGTIGDRGLWLRSSMQSTSLFAIPFQFFDHARPGAIRVVSFLS
jgi:hypothetical protein